MPKKLTTEEFIQKSRQIHGDKYDYSRVKYKNAHMKVEIVCPQHGSFFQKPYLHIQGKGCMGCSRESLSLRKRMGKDVFIQRAQQVHGDKYDYSKVRYKNTRSKVEIICPEHGSFWQLPIKHLGGKGCPSCGGTKKLTTDGFVQRAQQIHGDKYDYSKVQYVNSTTKVEIVCPEHASFYQAPQAHLRGQGCPECSKTRKLTTEAFIQKARKVHGDKYVYSLVEYINNRTKVEIICPAHGSFFQTPNDHLNGKGCLECSGVKKLTTEQFIQKAREVHGDKYDYSKVRYINSITKVEIICPQHGSFYQKPNGHLNGKGCADCVHHVSKGEQELADALKAKGLQVIQSYRKWHPERPKLEIDIYLPEYSIGIEYNGEYWHRDREKDEEKVKLALGMNINIITVWETEWKMDRGEVLERIFSCLKG